MSLPHRLSLHPGERFDIWYNGTPAKIGGEKERKGEREEGERRRIKANRHGDVFCIIRGKERGWRAW